MATIKSQMTLNDGISGVLKKITSALDVTLASFEQMRQVSGKAIDVAQIEAARGALANAGNAVDDMAENYRRAAQEEKKLNQGISQGTSAMGGLLGKVTSMVTAYANIGKAKSFAADALKAADVQIGAQVQLKTVMGNMGSLDYYDQVLDKAGKIQNRGMYGDEVMIAGAGELAAYFSDGEAVLSMMDTLTNYAAGMSNGGAVDAAAMVEYATGIGKIMTGSYDAMTKKGFEFTDAQKAIIEGSATEAQIAAELGAEYLDMSGDMQAAAVIGSVIDENWAGLYETMSNTPEGKLIQMNNALGNIKENVGAGIYPAVLNFVNMVQSSLPQIEGVAMGLAAVFGFIITFLTGMAEGAISFGTAVADNWGWIEPIVWGVVAALIAYNAVQGIGWLTTLSDIAAKGAHAIASAAQTAATLALAAAQSGLNAALLACPITWIIIAIIALIAVIVAVIRALDVWGASTHSVLGTITGLFTVAAAFMGNIIVAAVNFVIDAFAALWNFIAAFANFFGNVFNDPVGAIVRLFFDLVDVVLSLLQTLASAIDTLFGTELADAVQGWRDSLGDWVDDTFGEGEEIMATIDAENMHLGRFEYGEAFELGASFGDGISDAVGSIFDYDTGSMDDLMEKYGNTPGGPLSDLGSDVGAIADNTGSMADALEISGEELKYLRDIAERDAINRFTTAEIKVDMTGMTNKIDSSVDLDGFIRGLTDGVSESLAAAAEGVHG